jgi:hypothetical protein
METRLYTIELTDSEHELVRAFAARRRVDEEKLAAELRQHGPSPGKLELAARVQAEADVFRQLENMSGADDRLDLGTNLLRQWYAGRVSDLAEDVLRAILAGEVSDLQDYLHETVDGTDIVIYTYKASAALLASDSEDAWEEMGLERPTVEQRAYCALEADVRAELQLLANCKTDLPDGFDLDDSDTWTVQTDEDEDAIRSVEGLQP